ncbi:MAG: GNAT family N-acetyltransferase [Pseudomonadota bacterium]
MEKPCIGMKLLNKEIPDEHFDRFTARIVRSLDQFQQVTAIRAATFMAEQDCPFDEEYDGNDLSATHLIGYDGGRPIATLRLRWFAGFAKLERVCVLEPFRGTPIVKIMLATCFELAARKGYKLMIGQIQSRLVPLWSHVFQFEQRSDRPPLSFSNYEYVEIDIPLPEHPRAIDAYADPYEIIRPEGTWDQAGVLERDKLAAEKISDKAA